MIKKIISLVISCTLIFSVVCTALSVSAASPVSFTMTDVDKVSKGKKFKIEIKASQDGGGNINVGAFSFSLKYDTELLKYVENSFESKYFDMVSLYGRNGTLSFAWDSTKNVKVKQGTVFSLEFSATDKYEAQTKIVLEKGEVYKIEDSTFKLTKIFSGTSFAVSNINPAGADAQVETVIKKINDLPEPTPTAGYKTLLDDALSAYERLSYSQKQSVTNYDKLVKKYNDYMAMSEIQSDPQAEEWRNKYSDILSLNSFTVTFEHNDRIDQALAEWESDGFSIEARLETTNDRLFLKSLKEIIKKKYEEELAEQERERLNQRAQEIVNEFKDEWKNFIDLKEENVVAELYEPLKKFDDAIESLKRFGAVEPEYKLAYNLVVADGIKAHAQKLLEIALREYLKENPVDKEYILKAEDFKSKFSYVLSLTPDDLTYDDIADVNTAYIAYSFLDSKTKTYLTKEIALLEELLAKADTLAPDDDSDFDFNIDTDSDNSDKSGDKETEIVELVKRVPDNGTYSIDFISRGTSRFIWFFAIIDALSLILLGAAALITLIFRKKYNEFEQKGGINYDKN